MRDQYIPDLTERFPEGFGGVDMTDSYFPCESGWSDWPEDPFEGEEPDGYKRVFEIGDVFSTVGIYGGLTDYKVEEIDRDNKKILLSEVWYDVDGTGTRPAKWHDLVTDDDGNEKALEWKSDRYGEFWIEAYSKEVTE